jgi:hypothetical protein
LWLLLGRLDNEQAKEVAANGLVIRGKRSMGGVCFGKKFQKPKASNFILIERAPMNISKNLAEIK